MSSPITSESPRDTLRSSIIGRKSKGDILTFEGKEIELRCGSIRDRDTILKLCQVDDKGNSCEFNDLKFMILTVIAHTYIPGTNENIFEETDYDSLESGDIGGFIDFVTAHILEKENTDKKK
jgi:hypothetical protein